MNHYNCGNFTFIYFIYTRYIVYCSLLRQAWGFWKLTQLFEENNEH